jgi:NAD(P)-dependent dehydrogenase (short-subunit alcohol dehydrogenase family)
VGFSTARKGEGWYFEHGGGNWGFQCLAMAHHARGHGVVAMTNSDGLPDGLEGWNRIIAVNQTSVFLGTKLAADQMAKTGGGSIVNISSIMGFVGSTSGRNRRRHRRFAQSDHCRELIQGALESVSGSPTPERLTAN